MTANLIKSKKEIKLMIGGTADITLEENGFLGKSAVMFEKFYGKVAEALNTGQKVSIAIYDEESWIC